MSRGGIEGGQGIFANTWVRRGAAAAAMLGVLAFNAACGAEEDPGANQSPVAAASPSPEITPEVTPDTTPVPTTSPTVKESSAAPTAKPEKHQIKYPKHENIRTTFYYIGEEASEENEWIDNIMSEWESDARKSFGGVDHPDKRTKDGLPIKKPKQNPFYFALPASEFTEDGVIKKARKLSPWAPDAAKLAEDDSESLFKGKWIKVSNPETGQVVYGQWQDTGPGEDADSVKDYGYVFGDGSQKPKNKAGLKAGLDISPAMAFHVGFDFDAGYTVLDWEFVDEKDVPDGLWKKYPKIKNNTNWD